MDSSGTDGALRAELGQPVPGLLGTQVSPYQGSAQRVLPNRSAAAEEGKGDCPMVRRKEPPKWPVIPDLGPCSHPPRTTCDIWAPLGTAQWQQELLRRPRAPRQAGIQAQAVADSPNSPSPFELQMVRVDVGGQPSRASRISMSATITWGPLGWGPGICISEAQGEGTEQTTHVESICPTPHGHT